ncbi:MAG: hypothetical protein KKI08_22775 [Armatimonadetes bacterium]|nr:hypothetical protein [Armatimonadota bacterium]
MSKFVAVGLVVVIAALLLIGCSGTNDQTVYQWVLERVSYNLAATRVAFTSLGGNGVRYVYSVTNTGGNLTLLTPTDNDEDLTDEGGKQPAFSPDGVDMAIVARRGGGQQAIFLIDPTSGAGTREAQLTADNVAAPGADAQPSWSADSSQIVYVSTKGSVAGRWEIWIVNRDGTNPHMVARNGETTDAQWPVFSPDGTQIIYQSRVDATGVDTSLRAVNVAGGASTEIDGTEGNGFREGAPSVVNVGATPVVVFSSNRNGDFDIWRMNLDGSDAPGVALTDDSRSDGYPVWAADASRIAFTRDNEVWSIAADGSDPEQLTERFQNQ